MQCHEITRSCFLADNIDKKIVVRDVKDIVHPVGFLIFNSNERQYKVIWEGALYYKMLNGRKVGQRKDM